jgi:predicted O-methyltransferase YrrM
MKRALIIIGIAVGLALVGVTVFRDLDDVIFYLWSPALASPSAKTENEKRVLDVLNDMRESGKTYLSVDEESGRMLRVLTEAAGARHVVEVGTGTGYSGLWFCLALQTTGGRLTTFEIDPGRARMARENFKRAGVDRLVTVVEGDAHQKITVLTEPIDVVFLDADKDGYPDYLNKLLPLVRPGGLIVADNTNMAPEYREAIASNPALETIYWTRDVSVTLKKR